MCVAEGHNAAFHLGLHYLQKYLFRGLQILRVKLKPNKKKYFCHGIFKEKLVVQSVMLQGHSTFILWFCLFFQDFPSI